MTMRDEAPTPARPEGARPESTPATESLAERVARRRVQQAGASSQASPILRQEPVFDVAPVPPPAAVAEEKPRKPPVQIDGKALAALGVITPGAPPTAITECYRTIKRQLLKDAFPPPGTPAAPASHVIMVTSGLPGEGKTFTALNLAMALSSERDIHVLLVDGDCHKREIGRLLGVLDQPGLIDMLVDKQLGLKDCLLRTSIPNLALLPSGRPNPLSTELLASKQMGQLMADLAARYPDRVIIIDTPPVMATTEAAVLASRVGQAVVVVEKDKTTKTILQRCLAILEACPNVSCVLNMARDDIGVPQYEYSYNGHN